MNRKTLLKELNLSTYVALDFETTGLDPNFDKVIEVAAILFKNGEPKKTFSTLINPQQNISPFITNITGISNSMVSDAPKEKDIIYEKEQPRNANNKLIVIAGLVISAVDITNSTSFSLGVLISIIANFL